MSTLRLDIHATNLADPVTVARIMREQRTRIEDLEHQLRLLRQHIGDCERCQAVEDHQRDKDLENAS